jgi:hypothetical protein
VSSIEPDFRGGEVDPRKFLAVFSQPRGDGTKLFECAEEILDLVRRFVEFRIEVARPRAAGGITADLPAPASGRLTRSAIITSAAMCGGNAPAPAGS